MWYNITYRKRNRTEFLDEEETIDGIIKIKKKKKIFFSLLFIF